MGYSVFPQPSTAAEAYSVFSKSTSMGTTTTTISINIPSGIYRAEQSSGVNNSLTVDSNIIEGNTNAAVKFTSAVTSVSVTLTPSYEPTSILNTWTTRSVHTDRPPRAIMYGNSTYVMMLGNAGAGSQDIFARTSTDGITWTTRSTTHNLAGPLDGLYSSTDGLFVVVGGDNSPNITTSTDGITWQTRTSAFPGNTRAQAIAYYGGTYAAGGGTTGNANGVICTSTNGITWTTRTSNFGSAGIWAMAAGNGVFVAGGTAGTLRTSIDSGVTWVTRTSNFGTTHIYDIGYGDGVFIAGGGAGQLRRSTDGITWTTVSSPFTTSEIVNRVRYVDNVWIAGSNSLYISTDGNTWSLKAPSTFGTSNITAVGSGNGLFIVGVANTAFTSNNYSINNNLLTTFTKVTASE